MEKHVQTLTNVLLVHHHAIKSVQTLSGITRAHACLGLGWTVMEKLAMILTSAWSSLFNVKMGRRNAGTLAVPTNVFVMKDCIG